MMFARRGGVWIVVLSLIVAMALTIVPLPEWTRPFRPEWTALVLIYWCMALPHRVGVGVAWLTGLLLDALTGTLLGEHALGLSVVAYLALHLYKRIRLLPLWQQMPTILLLLGLHQLLALWVMGITGNAPQTWRYWGASFVGMALWPIVFVILRRLRRRFGVS